MNQIPQSFYLVHEQLLYKFKQHSVNDPMDRFRYEDLILKLNLEKFF